ncbi:MAG: RDD family protein [Alphaproteobacteria bacterium]
MLDILFIILASGVVSLLFMPFIAPMVWPDAQTWLFLEESETISIVACFFAFFYFVGYDGFSKRGSIGKRRANIYLAAADGGKLSPGAVLLRYVLFAMPSFLYAAFYIWGFQEIRPSLTGSNWRDEHWSEFCQHHWPDCSGAREAILFSGAIALAWMGFCILSALFTKERAGLHDLLSGARMYRRGYAAAVDAAPVAAFAALSEKRAGSIVRIFAFLVDGAVVAGILYLVNFAFSPFRPSAGYCSAKGMADFLVLKDCAMWLAAGAYFVLFEFSPLRASLGKLCTGLYVTARGKSKASCRALACRYGVWALPALYFISLKWSLCKISHGGEFDATAMGLAFFVVPSALLAWAVLYFLPMLISKERTGLHDKLSGTRVYEKPSPETSG